LLAAACAVGAVVLWDFTAYPRGGAVALIHQATKHYTVTTYGLASPWRLEYQDLLNTRYGVKLEVLAGCVVTEQLTEYVEGYNSISTAYMNKRFGHDIFAECSNDAKLHYDIKHARKTE